MTVTIFLSESLNHNFKCSIWKTGLPFSRALQNYYVCHEPPWPSGKSSHNLIRASQKRLLKVLMGARYLNSWLREDYPEWVVLHWCLTSFECLKRMRINSGGRKKETLLEWLCYFTFSEYLHESISNLVHNLTVRVNSVSSGLLWCQFEIKPCALFSPHSLWTLL